MLCGAPLLLLRRQKTAVGSRFSGTRCLTRFPTSTYVGCTAMKSMLHMTEMKRFQVPNQFCIESQYIRLQPDPSRLI